MSDTGGNPSNASRRAAMASGAALLGSTLLGGPSAKAQPGTTPVSAPTGAMPAGYNILFVLVDQEHFFPTWPFPVPAREAIKKKAITFLNHQAASCVCSSARSVVYTGQHIQQTGIADNLNYIWQRDLATTIKTAGHRLGELGYHAAYQGKWHLSATLDLTDKGIDAPLRKYRDTIESYGFKDFFGVGDLIDGTLGGYSYDHSTLGSAITGLRTEAETLRTKGQPWYLAVNFVNPHDVMYFNSDLPTENVQSASLTGKDPAARAKASEGLKGKDFSSWLQNPAQAGLQSIRLASLHNFDMLSFQDPKWAGLTVDTQAYRAGTAQDQAAALAKYPPNFLNRVAIRSIWDGRYRFSRYFSPVRFNTPGSLEELFAMNDVEVYDLQNDPEEMNNLATDPKRNGDLIVALNQEANRRIAEEVGEDNGHFLPIRDGKWHFPPASDR